MKKFTITLFLACAFVFSLSISVLANEGDLPIGGKTCPPNTTCLTEGNLPIGGKTCLPNTTCLTDNQTPSSQAEEPTIFKTVLDYLAQLFG